MNISDYATANFVSMITDLREVNSLTVVERACEVALERTDLSEKQRAILTHIKTVHDIDETRLTCAIYLGFTEEAQTLRDWISKRAERKQATDAFLADLEAEMQGGGQ